MENGGKMMKSIGVKGRMEGASRGDGSSGEREK